MQKNCVAESHAAVAEIAAVFRGLTGSATSWSGSRAVDSNIGASDQLHVCSKHSGEHSVHNRLRCPSDVAKRVTIPAHICSWLVTPSHDAVKDNFASEDCAHREDSHGVACVCMQLSIGRDNTTSH